MRSIILVFIIALVCLVLFSKCKNTSTGPDDILSKSPEELSWTVDTISVPGGMQTLMEKFLPFSTTNIYAYGLTDFCRDIWYYSGDKWELLNLDKYFLYQEINKMLAFSRNDIWGFGKSVYENSFIFRSDGVTWHEDKSGKTIGRLITACAESRNNMYAAGDNGEILFFDGNSWKNDSLKMKIPAGDEYIINGSAFYNGQVYFLAIKSNHANMSNTHFIIKGTYKNFAVADSMVLHDPSSVWKWGNCGFYVTPYYKLLSYGDYGIWQYNNNSWEHILYTENGIDGVFAINQNYIIATGAAGSVYFYNGNTFSLLNKFRAGYENVIYTDAWSDGKELFILGRFNGALPQKTIIWHGK